ncbi:hypothetical protein JX266_012550 [Neoarthrinium moseri]|uniref:uncharacterized protein n=1 Tax=Neoarthrinium moseri TaxID=1658444 RepID=UPI001FDC8284|nr:uncharacterized protein JN550_012944 [Neoarthrinium moseri]KAI1841238.1 hypothetical protein JX266_012550 [Neoarthrinium moseri]KAI1857869.1 hypothetical protein JN550_012944 [Neoarthrinium moseri]
METDNVDALLERYLHLLHEYTTLRAELSSLQTNMYQNIARANFSAERGIRYGPDFYDDRMQALRRLAVATNDEGVPVFSSATIDLASQTSPASKDAPEATNAPDTGGAPDSRTKEEPTATKIGKPKKTDPLQWFGILTPMPLRQAQGQSIQAVEQVIPKLVSVNSQMAQLEIEVRRARKHRAKAEASAKKQSQSVTSQEIAASDGA